VRSSHRGCRLSNPDKRAASADDEYAQAQMTTYVSIVINTGLGFLKLAAGVFGHSIAMVADAIHTLSDTATSVAVWLGLKIARRPADAAHPYGHGKAEPIAGKVVAIALFVVGFAIVYESVAGIWLFMKGKSTLEEPSHWTLYAALATILVKEWMYQYQVRIGRRLSLVSLVADAWHHRSDALSSVGVALGIGAAMLGGEKWHWADEAAALVVAIIIIWVAWQLFRQSSEGLMDTQTPTDMRAHIRDVAKAVPGVKGVEKIVARRSGADVLIDIHVEVDGELPVRVGHQIATDVRDRLMSDIPHVVHALVHIEPYYPDDHPETVV